jgi:lysozyme
MTPSADCVALVKEFEGCRLTAYKPTPNDVLTIGYGHTGPDVTANLTWTQAQADAVLADDLAHFSAGVSRVLTGPTAQQQYDALCDFAFNLGLGALEGSTLLKMHNASDYAGAQAQFGRWVHQGAETLPGLVRRRYAEAALYGSAVGA